MRILNVGTTSQSTEITTQKSNFKGLWGKVLESKHLGGEFSYGNELYTDKFEAIQEYYPFADETEQMTKEALANNRYESVLDANLFNATNTYFKAKIMPKLEFTAQNFVDYIGKVNDCLHTAGNVEAQLKKLNLEKYLKL